MCRSVPQIEATLTLTRTSVRPKLGIFTSRTSAPGAASGFTTASIVPAIIATYKVCCKNSYKHKTADCSTAPTPRWRFRMGRHGGKRVNRISDNCIQVGCSCLASEVQFVRSNFLLILLICACFFSGVRVSASPVAVHHKEGLLHGFLSL